MDFDFSEFLYTIEFQENGVWPFYLGLGLTLGTSLRSYWYNLYRTRSFDVRWLLKISTKDKVRVKAELVLCVNYGPCELWTMWTLDHAV